MNKQNIILILSLFLTISSFAQEVLLGLGHNQTIVNKLYENVRMEKSVKSTDTVWVTLPFYDDFSALSVFPNNQKWMDKNAFINAEYAKNSLTIGVATFDMIDPKGNIYANASQFGFSSDTMTSQPMRLDSIFAPATRPIRVSDSLYLSFYYQPQGSGLMPGKKDSLILEFHSPTDFDTLRTETDTTIIPRWHWVWSTSGNVPVDTFAMHNRNIYFKEVFIPITDLHFLKKGFQFRFRNYASLSSGFQPDWQSNGSQWNIDLVYLNVGRTNRDTIFRDLAFGNKPESFLKDYESMPYHQYRAKEIASLKEKTAIKIANLDGNNRNLSYKYEVRQGSNPIPIATYNPGEESLLPFLQVGYSQVPQHANPPVNVIFPPSTQEELTFHITHTITPASGIDNNLINNEIQYKQVFNNYYAYDDGTAEAGLGIQGAGMYAVAFKLNKRDSLHGIKMFINKTKALANQLTVDLCVWNNSQTGTPKDMKLKVPSVKVNYSDSINAFIDYWFQNTLIIDEANFPDLIFYVGWKQTSINNLNVGCDRNTDSHSKRFFNTNGIWESSSIIGSMMLRPIIGAKNPLGGTTNPTAPEDNFAVFPNPISNGDLNILLSNDWQKNTESIQLRLINVSGQVIYNQKFNLKLNINGLAKGMYFLQLINTHSGKRLTQKMIVN